MISDKMLINISIIIIMAGLVGITYITDKLPPITYNDFLETEEGQLIKFQGKIINSRQIKNITILTLQTNCEIPAISFKPLNVITNNNITIIGKKEIYNNKPEIIIENIIAS